MTISPQKSFLDNLIPIEKKQSIKDYSHSLAEFHKYETRQNGKSYYDDHILPTARKTQQLEIASEYSDIAQSIALLHDFVEHNKTENMKVFNPFSEKPKFNGLTLNSLFENAEKEGRAVCYGVARLTDDYPNKFAYMNSLLNIESFPRHREYLDVLTLLIKTCGDIWSNNSNPSEEYSRNPSKPVREEAKKAVAFLAKKARRSLELKYKYLPEIEKILGQYADIRVESEPLFNLSIAKQIIDETKDNIHKFFRLNPIMDIVSANNGLGRTSLQNLGFYNAAFQQLRRDEPEFFNYFIPEHLKSYSKEVKA